MSGDSLHDYHLALCDDALGNVRHIPNDAVFAAALCRGMSKPLARYIWEDDDEPDRLLLDFEDLFDLAMAAQMAP